MIRFALSVGPTFALALATATPQTDTIHKFYRALSTPSPTIATLKELFGGDSEAELNTLLEIYYHGDATKQTAFDEKAVAFTRERLSNDEHVSEFLRCIRRLRPRLFSSNSLVRIETLEQTGDESFDRIPVTTRGGKLIFVFGKGEKTIEDIKMPDVSSLSFLIPQCGRPSPSSGSGKSRDAPK